MKKPLTRVLTALSILSTAAMLSACGGATSTVDPFKPVRVIGLGDGYNDVGSPAVSGSTQFTGGPYTVRSTSEVGTVVEQLAAYFGVSATGTYVGDATYTSLPSTGTYSYANGNSLIDGNNGLIQQVDRLLADVTSFSSTDLVLITVGTQDIMAGTTQATAISNLKAQVARLLAANARHILIVQPLEVTNTPWGRANNASSTYTGKTVAFINAELVALQDLVRQGGFSNNPIIFTNATTLSSDFNIYTTTTPYLEFSASTQVPYCSGTGASSAGNSSYTDTKGCATTDGFVDTTYDTRLFADGIHLTPAGNRWVATRVYYATASGWR